MDVPPSVFALVFYFLSMLSFLSTFSYSVQVSCPT